ncbi:MAG: carotenoid biosynthesis protein [Bacteroidota bacterium]
MIFSKPILASLNKAWIGIFVVYLFHVSALIGVSLGYYDWFIRKTPLNLSLMLVLMIWIFPLDSTKKRAFALFVFGAGMLVEWLGVRFGWFFGTYAYGENLGIKLDGVPLLIGVNWTLLVLSTGVISNQVQVAKWIRAGIGAGLMVGLDILMEVSAPSFDFWVFEDGIVPLNNYIAWFVIAYLLHLAFQQGKIQGNKAFCIHLFLSQCLFFSFFYVYHTI